MPAFPLHLPSASHPQHFPFIISHFSFDNSEICDFEFWLEIKLSLAISIRRSSGALCKQAYARISHPTTAPTAISVSPRTTHCPATMAASSSRRRTLCIVSFALCSLILRFYIFFLHDTLLAIEYTDFWIQFAFDDLVLNKSNLLKQIKIVKYLFIFELFIVNQIA